MQATDFDKQIVDALVVVWRPAAERSCSCSLRERAGWASICPPSRRSSSWTPTGTPGQTCRRSAARMCWAPPAERAPPCACCAYSCATAWRRRSSLSASARAVSPRPSGPAPRAGELPISHCSVVFADTQRSWRPACQLDPFWHRLRLATTNHAPCGPTTLSFAADEAVAVLQ